MLFRGPRLMWTGTDDSDNRNDNSFRATFERMEMCVVEQREYYTAENA